MVTIMLAALHTDVATFPASIERKYITTKGFLIGPALLRQQWFGSGDDGFRLMYFYIVFNDVLGKIYSGFG